MSLYMDISVLTLATFITGIQRVTREYTTRMVRNAEDVKLLHYNAAEDCYHLIDNDRFIDYYVNHKGKKEKMITKETVSLEKIGTDDIFFDIDAAWMSKNKRSYILPILKKQGVTIISHIYDIISITHPQYCLERGVYNFADYITAHLLYDDKILVNAQATKSSIEKLCECISVKCPPIEVIPLGADFTGIKKADEEKIPEKVRNAASKPFVLMVGTVEPRKNHKMLLDAYDIGLKNKGFSIVFAGYMGWNMEAFSERLQNHPDYQNGVYHFEGLDDNAISYLYEKAECLAFLSYTEGYGLPIVEALARNVKVVAADVDVYKEVGKDKCIWVEQDNCEALTEAVTSGEISNQSEGIVVHSWDECFERVRKSVLNEK